MVLKETQDLDIELIAAAADIATERAIKIAAKGNIAIRQEDLYQELFPKIFIEFLKVEMSK